MVLFVTQQMIRDLHLAKQQTWEERERLSAVFEEDRRKNLANKASMPHSASRMTCRESHALTKCIS